MSSPQLSPVPPLTALGFTDPVWARWLLELRNYINFSVTAIVFDGGGGLGGSTVVGSNGQVTITLSTPIVGLVKGNGSGFVPAIQGTDYLKSFTAAAPLLLAPGLAPALSLPVATAAANGYLSAVDWGSFNGKLGAVTWGIVSDKPTTLAGYGVTAVDAVPIGAVTPSTGVFTALTANTATVKALDFTEGLADSGYSYSVPVTGFAVTVAPTTSHVVFAPVATLASGSVTLPTAARDGLLLRIVSTKDVTAITITPGTGQTVIAAPVALAANVAVAWLYRLANKTWYRMQ